MKCKAKSKRTGKKCNANAMNGTDLCYHHGGRSKIGFALPQTKEGKYSKHLPTRLTATYEQTIADKNLWKLEEKAGLVDARIVELISKLDTGETGATWAALKGAFRDLRKAINEGNRLEMIRLLVVVENLIEAGNNDYLNWAEITQQIETYRKLSESERKYQADMQRIITAEQAMLMIAAITDVIKQNVADRDTLFAISAGINKIIAVDPGQ